MCDAVDSLFAVVGRRVIMLVMAGKPVDATIGSLLQYLEPGDCIIDGGNEWCVCVTVKWEVSVWCLGMRVHPELTLQLSQVLALTNAG